MHKLSSPPTPVELFNLYMSSVSLSNFAEVPPLGSHSADVCSMKNPFSREFPGNSEKKRKNGKIVLVENANGMGVICIQGTTFNIIIFMGVYRRMMKIEAHDE